MSKIWDMSRIFPFEITDRPDELGSEIIRPGKTGYYQKIDDSVIELDRTTDRKITFLIGIGMILAPLFWYALVATMNTFNYIRILFLLVFSLPGIFTIINSRIAPEKKMIFRRLEGTVEIPGFLKRTRTIPFIEISPILGGQGIFSTLAIRYPCRNWSDYLVLPISIPSNHQNHSTTWSLIVWYMDKNRPLPPGTVFDPYRKKDDERRKKEGNPPPLFPSSIHDELGRLYPTEKSRQAL